ncbi:MULTISPECIES: alpha/beta fold hydrolase [unclassified Streptomyces]|uniref:alpha/beta fold hydrolase n=1 Tax=unclassified Streptomyces TaxID=2593676 RepID=UPI00081D4D5A|nr:MULTISPECIES: alpha/beta fold hydrolase [unclassified Streptomyces]MYR93998.1 alpha/beta fold hydrolase [Streptomyces sp. SID4937]SCD63393.1 ABC-2 type transport system ATP-binding protein [Streptomyces sp. ScaeMP-e83]
METPTVRWRRLLPRTPGRWAAAVAALAVLVGGGTWTAVADDGPPAVQREDRMLRPGGVEIDTSYFTAGGSGKRPAVLIGHGFGGSKNDVRAQAEKLAADGYAVLTWSARGFGKSGGAISLNDPDGEVKDVSGLIDWLAERPEVELDKKGDPRVGLTGASYGGAVSLLAAGHDQRVDAIAPVITYWNLADALFPDGVFKKLWAGIFVTSGGGCEKFEKKLCEMYERVAVSGKPDAEAVKLLTERSPSAVADRIKVPSLLLQGQSDSLFPLGHADAMQKAISANGAPVSVDWISGGHDGGDNETARVEGRVGSWFDRYLKEETGTDTGPAFRVTRTGGIDSTDGAALKRGASSDTYPGLRSGGREIALRAGGSAPTGTGPSAGTAEAAGTGTKPTSTTETFRNPAGSAPPAISAVPGVGGGLSQLSSLGVGLSLDFPGQFGRFESAPLATSVRVTGTPTARVTVEATEGRDAVLFGKVYDVSPDGRQQVLPSQLVAPYRITPDQQGKPVELALPAVDHEFDAGHRMRLVFSATDLGYASPAEPATYTVTLDGPLTVPTAPAVTTAAATLPWWTWGLPAAALVIAAALLLTARRRTATPAPDPELADVPLQITGLSKKYAKSVDRYAVRELSFRVEKGQVLGLLGPNGAGKTTTLRMLMGLITPDEGEIRVFGQAIRPGAPVLSRVGAFVEGAGFLPHLSGRANLDLYWQATGRPAEDAHIEEALEIAGLGDALARAVRTYSQGMRQRLAIAQAMLGMPDLLILDEPTNGLDPPQIREMRDVMIRYAAGGRTVIVSSHLLSEVEQSCTHLVVMDRGRLVQAGPVAEITGSGDMILVTTAEEVSEPLAEKVAALPGIGSAVRTDDGRGLLVRLDGATTSRLVADLVRLDVPVTGVGPHRRLEDAFLTLISGGAA